MRWVREADAMMRLLPVPLLVFLCFAPACQSQDISQLTTLHARQRFTQLTTYRAGKRDRDQIANPVGKLTARNRAAKLDEAAK